MLKPDWLALKPCRFTLRHGWLAFRSGWLALSPGWLALSSGQIALSLFWGGKQTDQWMIGWMDGKSPHATGLHPQPVAKRHHMVSGTLALLYNIFRL